VLLVPLLTESYLKRFVDALMSSDYAGLMVLLGRTADAREQHQEIVRDWASFHDLTNSAIAVLCPDPNADPGRSTVRDPVGPRMAYSPGLAVVHPSGSSREHFDDRFWRAYGSTYREVRDSEMMDRQLEARLFCWRSTRRLVSTA
jgi:hypothetical protein